MLGMDGSHSNPGSASKQVTQRYQLTSATAVRAISSAKWELPLYRFTTQRFPQKELFYQRISFTLGAVSYEKEYKYLYINIFITESKLLSVEVAEELERSPQLVHRNVQRHTLRDTLLGGFCHI